MNDVCPLRKLILFLKGCHIWDRLEMEINTESNFTFFQR